MLLRFAANFDTKCRIRVVNRFMAENLQLADESKHEYMRRVHWAVLQNVLVWPGRLELALNYEKNIPILCPSSFTHGL
jgi:hypothetical protein